MWKVANSARQEMRPRGTGDQAGNSRRGKMKGKYPYRTKHPNFSHQLEHVGPNKQILEVQAHRICYLAPCANNRKEWQDLHKLVAKKTKKARYRDTGYQQFIHQFCRVWTLGHLDLSKSGLGIYLKIPTHMNLGYNEETTFWAAFNENTSFLTSYPPNLKGFKTKTTRKCCFLNPYLMEFGSE